MSLSVLTRSPKVRRAFALASVVLATGGLVLYKAPSSSAHPMDPFGHSQTLPLTANGKSSVAFSGPGAHGVFALSHTKVLSGTSTPVYAEVRLVADQTGEAKVRAPISLAVVLDTSGSMSGEKIEDAKRSVLRLLADMRDEDEIAMVRYSSNAEVVQPLARVGSVRSSLTSKIRELRADGGTNIPEGLRSGLRTLDEASRSRVKRIVLVSDGLDSTRAQAESLARGSFSSGITVSSLGIGNDFDESYMGAVAQSGHGNFAFIKEGASLAGFLKRELEESATTTIENARVQVNLPRGMRFVSATGADATVSGDSVDLRLGALFAGDEQRVILELESDGSSGEVTASATWNKVGGGDTARASIPQLSLVATNDRDEVERGRDGAVFASATSVTASKRQLEAASAYARGDVTTATALVAENERALKVAAAAAPPAAAPAIQAQLGAYEEQKKGFANVRPSSEAGKSMAKSAAAKDMGNLRRAAKY
ncbi:MAG: VWA domain-containing protein [Labilithrix sp.]|nr:VWA domain-containing protein [Labilithrix sp.]MCW5811326.1 VWA domain-containing protein [Labilithrix sp.]